ncbi:hypothetical protein Rsub_00972 [Raphidocelis subcapitata]|uniref:Ankyrin repeat n=1 Tax=Raphidocelis subcapitata TaxID=307507 RepID=A0A2V0NRR5_9CHLO|nr:hypothetical protein Rsub_00972 [Raphidocelis subcapitata]|eukprot:GBF88260.1 hypothetical protein Rsub_00972 [Raphidocelis subcapitata]
MPRPPARAPALLLALLALATAAPRPAAAAQGEAPPTMNPYANQPYAGCEGGYCAAAAPELEAEFWRAAAAGDAAAVGRLLKDPRLNTTRNVVPDSDGFVRVIDAAVWAAAKHGRIEVMKEIRHPVSGRAAVHDWRGDYVSEAVATGHPVVLELLFAAGYEITWNNAQELVKLAASVGKPETLRHLLEQPTVRDDDEELEESIENALKVAAEEGKEAIVEFILSNKNYSALAKGPCPAAVIKATMYGHNGIVRRLQAACNVSATSERLQAAGWLGALFNAARGGHARVVRLLLADEEAPQMLSKLYADLKPRKDGPPRAPNPEKDPLGVAAARGHLDVVGELSSQRALCAPCAAIAAAAAGHADVFIHLVVGPARNLLEASSDKMHDTLRAVAGALERGSWDVLRALLSAHSSDMVGAYFLPAIAQQGRTADFDKMVELIDQIGCSDPKYLKSQISSAQVSAALTGQVEMLVAFEKLREAPPGIKDGKRKDKGGSGGGGGDHSEL